VVARCGGSIQSRAMDVLAEAGWDWLVCYLGEAATE
jgi:hypothetical protein